MNRNLYINASFELSPAMEDITWLVRKHGITEEKQEKEEKKKK